VYSCVLLGRGVVSISVRSEGPLLGKVFTRAIASETCLPERLPGNVFTERLPRESGYLAFIQPQNGCIKGAVRQRVREGVRVRCWPGVFAILPEQRRAFLLVSKLKKTDYFWHVILGAKVW
jgi:hypothetical protein